MMNHERIQVSTTGVAGSASGTALSQNVICGHIEAAYLTYAAGNDAGCNVAAGMRSTPTESFLSVAGTASGWVYPRRAVHDSDGAAIEYGAGYPVHERYGCYEHVQVSVTATDALTDAVTVDLFWTS